VDDVGPSVIEDPPSVAQRPDLIERRLSRFLREPVSVRNAASVIVMTTLVIVVAGGIAIRLLDHHEYSSIWLGMWWSLQTVTTVGYGDVTPTNASGKIVGALVMLQGIAFLAITTAAITSTFVARAQAQRDAAEQAQEDLADDRLDASLHDLSDRMDRVERLLIKLTEE
jgi:voltage-gated potassium channel